jgi:hypothetical protein
MRAKAEIGAGICGFKTTCRAASKDDQNVTFEIESECEKIRDFAAKLKAKGEVDAFEEISAKGESIVLSTSREILKGCCGACAAPIGVFKAMQVAAGIALPKDIQVKLTKD